MFKFFQTNVSTTAGLLIAVGVLWGATNPFIRLSSQGIETINTGSTPRNILLELKMLGKRYKYWIPFLLNQSGSILYVWLLQNCSTIVAVPVTNSLSLVFTAASGCLIGERRPTKKVMLGTALVCLGSSLLVYDQMPKETQ